MSFLFLDGSENAQVSIDVIPNNEMPHRFVEEEFKLLGNDEDEDEDASENDENGKFDFLTDQEIPLHNFILTLCISPPSPRI